MSPATAATLLSKKECLGSILQYNDTTGQWFIYGIRGPGVWAESSELYVSSLITAIMRKCGVYNYLKSPSYVANVRASLQCMDHILCTSYPENPRDLFVFTNGVIKVDLQGGLLPHHPDPACYTLLPYEYDPTAKCPHFHEFINAFSSHKEDRVELIRAFLRCCLCSWTHVQKFMEVVGEGNTGKSVFQATLMALVGFQNTVVTSLRDLNSNTFEVSNLQHKKLICVSDTEFYSGPVGVLKQITGNDFLIGRRKHQQGAVNIFIEGMVIIIGNYPMYPRDATTGFLRRLIQFPATNVVKDGKEETLIQASASGEFTGPLADELSGIFNWVMGQDPQEAEKILRNSSRWVPSLRDSVFRGPVGSNSISSWVEDEIIPGSGMYVGGAVKDPSNTDMAYPTYLGYCTRNGLKPVSLKVFTTNLLSIIRDSFEWKGFRDVGVQRKMVGMYIRGITRSPLLNNADYLRGGALGEGRSAFPEAAPASSETIRASSDTIPAPSGTIEPTQSDIAFFAQEARLRPSLREVYKELLEEPSVRKKYLRKDAKNVDVPINLEDYVPENASKLYREGVLKVLERGLHIYKKRGPVVDSYANLGVSPRIGPYQYGTSYNSIKRSLRDKLVNWSGQRLKDKFGYRLIDIDLASCFTSILLGLYNSRLPRVQQAVEQNLWSSLEKEFAKQGHGAVFDKPSVKIAVHASLFRGGPTAMINGITDKWRKDAGLVPREWKNLPESKQVLERAQEIASVLTRTAVIVEERELSSFLEHEWTGKTIHCPTGHKYLVSKETFGADYSRFLQSYEICLVAESICGAREEIPELEVLGHFHDGALLMYPDGVADVLEVLRRHLDKASTQLKLVYPQKWEVKWEI